MAYEIAFKASVAKDLKKLDPSDARRILDRTVLITRIRHCRDVYRD